jgi:hypothetical protein
LLSRSRSPARPSARHAVAAGMHFERLPSSVLLYGPQLERERSRSPSKGKGKCKDKGKGKGQAKGQGKDWHMNAFKKNSGFKKVNFQLFDCFFDIDIFEQTLWLVPLANPVRGMTNPVYAFKPAQGAPHKQILPDLSHSPDCDGIMAIGPLEIGPLGTKEFICANVRLSTGEEGWINVAMSDLSDLPRQSRQWTIYLKVCAVDRPTPIRPIMDGASSSTDDNGARAQWLDHYDEYRCMRLQLKKQEDEHADFEEGGSTLDSECSTDSQGYRIEDFLPEEPEYMQFLKRREAKKKEIYEGAKRTREKAEEECRRKSIRR